MRGRLSNFRVAPIAAALFVAMFLLVSALPGSLHAYLDPGTGSIALQLILGGLVAALATLRLYWDRVKTFLHRRHVEHDVTPNQN